jgi:hypothetical protein
LQRCPFKCRSARWRRISATCEAISWCVLSIE